MVHTTSLSSDRESVSDLPQLGVKFLVDSNSWNVNGESQN